MIVPPQGSAGQQGAHGTGFFTASANYRVYCLLYGLGFFADAINSLIHRILSLSFRVSYSIFALFGRYNGQYVMAKIHTHNNLVIEQKV